MLFSSCVHSERSSFLSYGLNISIELKNVKCSKILGRKRPGGKVRWRTLVKKWSVTTVRIQTGAGVQYLGCSLFFFVGWRRVIHLHPFDWINSEGAGKVCVWWLGSELRLDRLKGQNQGWDAFKHRGPAETEAQERSLFGLTKPNIPHNFLLLPGKKRILSVIFWKLGMKRIVDWQGHVNFISNFSASNFIWQKPATEKSPILIDSGFDWCDLKPFKQSFSYLLLSPCFAKTLGSV